MRVTDNFTIRDVVPVCVWGGPFFFWEREREMNIGDLVSSEISRERKIWKMRNVKCEM